MKYFLLLLIWYVVLWVFLYVSFFFFFLKKICDMIIWTLTSVSAEQFQNCGLNIFCIYWQTTLFQNTSINLFWKYVFQHMINKICCGILKKYAINFTLLRKINTKNWKWASKPLICFDLSTAYLITSGPVFGTYL